MFRRVAFAGLGFLLFAMMACTEMDHTYEEFWKDGEKTYPAFADSIRAYSGKDRIELEWLIFGDPSVTRAKVYWNSGKDSVEVPITTTGRVDTINVMLSDMPEGFYVFEIYTYDDKGNSSLKASAVGTVYGDTYISLLFNRPVTEAHFDGNKLSVFWGPYPDASAIGSELRYINLSGDYSHVNVVPESDTTSLADYDFDANNGHIHYRTLYRPDSLLIDTLYTAYVETEVEK